MRDRCTDIALTAYDRRADIAHAEAPARALVGRRLHRVPGRDAEAAPGNRILDVGCGEGLAEVSHRPAAHLAGPAGRRRSACSSKVARGAPGDGRRTTSGSGSRPPTPAGCRFATASFDSMYCVAVLQHIDDVEAAVAEFARVTAPQRPRRRCRARQQRALRLQLDAGGAARVRRCRARFFARCRRHAGDGRRRPSARSCRRCSPRTASSRRRAAVPRVADTCSAPPAARRLGSRVAASSSARSTGCLRRRPLARRDYLDALAHLRSRGHAAGTGVRRDPAHDALCHGGTEERLATNVKGRSPSTLDVARPEGHEGWDDYAPFYDWENARTLGRRDVPVLAQSRDRRPADRCWSSGAAPAASRCRSGAPACRSSASIAPSRCSAARARARCGARGPARHGDIACSFGRRHHGVPAAVRRGERRLRW